MSELKEDERNRRFVIINILMVFVKKKNEMREGKEKKLLR